MGSPSWSSATWISAGAAVTRGAKKVERGLQVQHSEACSALELVTKPHGTCTGCSPTATKRHQWGIRCGGPWFIYGCQVYALQNFQARHYRELIARAYELQGYRVKTVDRPPTTAEAKRCTTQAAHTDASNLKEAGLIADAEISDTEDLSKAGQSKGLHKKRICEVFDIEPDAVTANHVLDKKRAFATLRNHYLLNDETALGFCTHVRLEQLGDAYVLDKARIAQLHLKLH